MGHSFLLRISENAHQDGLRITAQQALAWLQEMDEIDSDGGEVSFVFLHGSIFCIFCISVGRNVTTDNLFSSLSLSHRLLQHNTMLLGMVNKVRCELPQIAKDTAQREVFSTSVLRSGSVSLTLHAPKKTRLCVLSSMPQGVTISDGRKRKPNTIIDYNHMKVCECVYNFTPVPEIHLCQMQGWWTLGLQTV